MSYIVICINYHDINYVDNNLSLNFFFKPLDQYNISSKIELQSLLLFQNKNESKRYCEAKELFDSAYALSKKKDHQWRHMMF